MKIKKRFTAMLAALLISLSILPCQPVVAFGSADINSLIDVALRVSSAERKSYITLLAPMFMVDSGIDTIISMVQNYEEGKNSGFLDDYIKKALAYVPKDILINMLKSVKCTPVTQRRILITALKDPLPKEISAEATENLKDALEIIYIDIPSLKTLMEQDGTTTPILANILYNLAEINGGNAYLLYDKREDRFVPGTILPQIKDGLNSVWAGYIITESGIEAPKDGQYNPSGTPFDAEMLLERFADKTNSVIKSGERDKIAAALKEVGLVSIKASGNQGGNIGGDKPSKPIVDKPENSDTQLDIVLDAEKKIMTIPCTMERPAMFLVDGENHIPVKYAVLDGENLVAVIDKSGKYIIRDMALFFDDSAGWSQFYIETLYARGIINGKADKIFAPSDNITREEFIKLIVELLDIPPFKTQSNFTDINADAWYAPYVEAAYKNGLTDGIGDGRFGVGSNIKRQDMAKIINTVLSKRGISVQPASYTVFGDFDAISEYAKGSVLSIYNLGIISGDDMGNFNPMRFATRAEAAKMIYGMLTQIVKGES